MKKLREKVRLAKSRIRGRLIHLLGGFTSRDAIDRQLEAFHRGVYYGSLEEARRVGREMEIHREVSVYKKWIDLKEFLRLDEEFFENEYNKEHYETRQQ